MLGGLGSGPVVQLRFFTCLVESALCGLRKRRLDMHFVANEGENR